MLRLLIAFSCLIATITLGTAAPIPKDTKKPVLYFPTKAGFEWKYEYKGGYIYNEKVTMVEQGKEGAALVTAGGCTYEVSQRGVFAVANGDDPIDPPICHIKIPFKAGEKWENKMTFQNKELNNGLRNVVGIEKVEVPAGKFDAIRVEHWPSTEPGEKEIRHTIWYARDIGMVKLESTAEVYNLVLKSFTPAKD